MDKLPLARNENIVVQDLDKEVLIYDLTIDKAFCLNETSAIVYRACDGKMSFDELKRKHQLTDDLIYLALDELQRENLIKSAPVTHFAGLSRREAVRRVGQATVAALPVIASLVAPHAANAQSVSACQDPYPNCYTAYPFTQGNCCPGEICDGTSHCVSCIPSGQPYRICVGDNENCLRICYESDSVCCDGGRPTFSNYTCYCP